MKNSKNIRRLEETVVFALFGAMMYLSAQIDIIPNVHPLALFIVILTVVYRAKALIPIYLYVFLEGFMGGFNLWWWPYLYIWTVLWLLVMLVPRRINEGLAAVLLTAVAFIHGLSFGFLYLPYQCYALFNGNWEFAWIWLVNGSLFDIMHAVGNLTAVLLAVPMIKLLSKLSHRPYPYKDIKFKK